MLNSQSNHREQEHKGYQELDQFTTKIELVAFDTDDDGPLSGFQIGLTVSNSERSRGFYGNVLGLAERPALPLPANIAPDTLQHMFRANATSIKFWAPPTERSRHNGDIFATTGIRYISIPVADLEMARNVLMKRGAKFVTAPQALFDDRNHLFVTDPDENMIKVVEVGRLRSE
jgi:catechol 2,3-dioxygenase-like lactoylglutathione lyase family enzyme